MHTDRAYGIVDGFKHQDGSILLTLNEKPRTPLPFPDKDECPKCGNKDVIRTKDFFDCKKCGTPLDRDRAFTFPELKDGMEHAICIRCHKEFVRQIAEKSKYHDYCQVCRVKLRSERDKKRREEKLALMQKQGQEMSNSQPTDSKFNERGM